LPFDELKKQFLEECEKGKTAEQMCDITNFQWNWVPMDPRIEKTLKRRKSKYIE
jgi:hypothetical protein